MRTGIGFNGVRRRQKIMLRYGQEKHRANRLREAEGEMTRIFGDADNLVSTGRFVLRTAEIFSDGIFISEELSRKRFVDDGDTPRRGRILIGDAASAKNRISDDLKVASRDTIERSRVVFFGSGSRMPIDPDATTPTVAAERRVQAKSDGRHSWDARERIV